MNPVVIGCESRAPDDVRHLEGPSILEDGTSVPRPRHSRHSFDACSGEVLSSHPARGYLEGVRKVVAELSSR